VSSCVSITMLLKCSFFARGEISPDGLDIKSEAPKSNAQSPVIIGRIKYHPTIANVCAISLIVLPGFCAEFR
jgi:hypothetical protein